ncbi:MAG: cation:proton antiporter [Bacteroidetes bacterium]|nr:cation:proton antiporter [Bacteroidota bacterium]HET6244351.1 cation:proton antiporter [Bacteroidia bacterium]
MELILKWWEVNFPIVDPVLIFSLVLFIILLSPILLQRFRVPAVVGLLLAGVVIGPHALNLLERDKSFELFGMVGLLYIMFLAGLELDLTQFRKNKSKSLVFGFITFLIPQALGILVAFYILNFNIISSVLLASMFASHTLIAYPVVSRLGITRTQVVTVIIGGTLVTNIIALMILSVITSMSRGELETLFWVEFLVSLSIYGFIVFWGIPKIGRWFFKNFEGQGGTHYIFVLAVVFAASYFANAAKIEPIIGAFIAGLAMNKLIPNTSPLMNRIDFIGNNLFIPFFLIGVGMLINLRVFFNGTEALKVAALMIVVALLSKWIAAFITQKIFNYSKIEKNLMFGLSSAQAASTLAAVTIGFNLGLLNENVLNGTILMILFTCLISSFVTEKAGRELAIIEGNKAPDLWDIPNRVLVPISNPATIENLMDLAIMIKNDISNEPIFALAVVKDDVDAKEKLVLSERMLEKAISHASSTENAVRVVTRVDLNIASGVIRAIRDLMITEVIIGWNAKISAKSNIFGNILDVLLENSEQMILVSKIINPLNTIDKIVVLVPPNAEYEKGFIHWVRTIKKLSKQTGASVVFYSSDFTKEKLIAATKATKPAISSSYKEFNEWDDFSSLSKEIKADDLLVIISARKSTVSYKHFLDNVPKNLAKYFESSNFIIVFPEQTLEPDVFKHMQ